MRTKFYKVTILAMILVIAATSCGSPATATQPPVIQPPVTQPTAVPPTAVPSSPTAQPFIFGMLLVGTHNDSGYSNAHYDAGLYVEQHIPNSKMLYLDNVYSGSPTYPGQTASQLAEQLVGQGAKLIIFNSDDMKDETLKFANAHPDIYVIGASMDWTWKDGKNYQVSPNQVDVFGRLEYYQAIGGCAAALTTQTGKIGFLGPLINDETRRTVSATYLGAKYCWTNILHKDPNALQFKVTWIGFWFNIPGVTSDPTQVADDFYNNGYDVVSSGIDTTEALVEAKKLSTPDHKDYAISQSYQTNCSVAPDNCLGVGWTNYGPMYLSVIKTAIDGTWKEDWVWGGPDWKDINNVDTSSAGYVKGAGLSAANSTLLDSFIAQLGNGLNLWKGPLNFQDGTVYMADGQIPTDPQIWYLPQLLQGITGQSVPSQ